MLLVLVECLGWVYSESLLEAVCGIGEESLSMFEVVKTAQGRELDEEQCHQLVT